MNSSAETILTAALALEINDRLRIAEQLFESVPDRPELDSETGSEGAPALGGEVSEIWLREIERRAKAVQSGRMRLIPFDQAIAEIEKTRE